MRVSELSHLVGNPYAYAVQQPNGTWYKVLRPLDDEVLYNHLRGGPTVGTYLLRDDTARTLVLDFDNGEQALEDAEAACDALEALGFRRRALGLEFSGNKGYHVWLVVGSYVPAAWLRRIGKAALALANVTAEVYPKQDRSDGLGNLIKLPGGVHQVSGRRAEFIRPPRLVGQQVVRRVVDTLPPEPEVRDYEPPPPYECLQTIQSGVPEGTRNDSLFHFTAMMRRAGLREPFLSALVSEVNDTCQPPLDETELATVISSSANYGPKCTTLPDSVRCENCPLAKGRLRDRRGAIREGVKGEPVVVFLGERDRDQILIHHQDIEVGRVKLK